MLNTVTKAHHLVHCRTGSLENTINLLQCVSYVHCRTGSLEILAKNMWSVDYVHCRTGSLERKDN